MIIRYVRVAVFLLVVGVYARLTVSPSMCVSVRSFPWVIRVTHARSRLARRYCVEVRFSLGWVASMVTSVVTGHGGLAPIVVCVLCGMVRGCSLGGIFSRLDTLGYVIVLCGAPGSSASRTAPARWLMCAPLVCWFLVLDNVLMLSSCIIRETLRRIIPISSGSEMIAPGFGVGWCPGEPRRVDEARPSEPAIAFAFPPFTPGLAWFALSVLPITRKYRGSGLGPGRLGTFQVLGDCGLDFSFALLVLRVHLIASIPVLTRFDICW